MSGGSLDYLYNRVEEAALKIAAHYGNTSTTYSPAAVAFSKLLMQVSKALKDIEWDMSGDGSDWEEVFKLIGKKEQARAVAEDLQALITTATELLADLKAQ
jgi:hypothetical protein